jgi:hypothetical protein
VENWFTPYSLELLPISAVLWLNFSRLFKKPISAVLWLNFLRLFKKPISAVLWLNFSRLFKNPKLQHLYIVQEAGYDLEFLTLSSGRSQSGCWSWESQERRPFTFSPCRVRRSLDKGGPTQSESSSSIFTCSTWLSNDQRWKHISKSVISPDDRLSTSKDDILNKLEPTLTTTEV